MCKEMIFLWSFIDECAFLQLLTSVQYSFLILCKAQARCHRIGQNKMVKVYRLITRNSYEREMFDRASLKLGLDRAVLQSMNSQQQQTNGVSFPPLYTSMYEWIYACMYMYVCIYVCMYVCMYACMYICSRLINNLAQFTDISVLACSRPQEF